MKESAGVLDSEAIGYVLEAYERGQTIEALRRAETFASLKDWKGAKACVLASRIAANSGAPRLSTRLSLRAWKSDKHNLETLTQYGYEILGRRGPLALWQMLRGWQETCNSSAEHLAEVLALKGRAAAVLRDFANAEKLIDRAESTDPNRAWIRLQRAYLLESQDRVEEALVVAAGAGKLHPHPFYRPAVLEQAQLLQLLDRDDDAIQLLREAEAVLQSGPVAVQLYALLSENGRWIEAEAALDRYVSLSPLMEGPLHRWVNSQRARVAYHLGRRPDAARFAALLEDDFHKEFAAKLGVATEGFDRVQLDVTFVRQHFKTCAPATLAAIGRYWKMPTEHLKLAEAICYDGTPAWQQRDWAEKNGWFVREFRVTMESAVALVEKGVPFAISTVEATSAHMMAVIGFDRTRATLLLRDPGQPYVIEAQAGEFLKRYGAFGPRAMVLLPETEFGRLGDVTLPDTGLYESYHRFWLALSKHDRDGAAGMWRQMESDSPEAALTWEARLDLAGYDANNAEQVRCLEKLLEFFPNNPARLLRKLGCMGDASRDERIQYLEGVSRAKDADPALFIALARTLQGDARCLEDARRWLRRAMRFRPMDTTAISTLADLQWEEGQFDQATDLYRFAANIEGFREHFYQSWFIACRRTRRTREALAHLQDRFKRFGSRSDQPALTLAWAWCEMNEPASARQVLEEAILLRPDDGNLLLRAASLVAGVGDAAEADKFLNAARGRVRENDWLRTSAEIAENRLDFATSLQVSRDLLQREPLALDAHAGVARAVARRDGTAVALTELSKSRARFPHHYGLQRMIVEWSRDAGPEAVAAAAQDLLRLEPSDAWAHRELALALVRMKRNGEALSEAIESTRIEPRNTFSFSVLGHVHRQLGQPTDARAQYRRAVGLSVDNGDAVNALLDLSHTDKERKEELAFIERELVGQVVVGDGLLAFVDMARPILDPEGLLQILQQAHTERPDLWHAWAALVSQLGHMGRLDEALTIAERAGQRFPYLPRTCLDLAQVHRWNNQPDEEIKAAERAVEMNPGWNQATLILTSALERRGRLEDARCVFERALRHVSRDAQLHACHAHLLWRLQRTGDSFAAIERALRLAPAYDWAWELLSDWAGQMGQPERTTEFARTLTADRPGEMRIWLMLARVLTKPEVRLERLAAIERAIALDNRSTEAWDLKAQLLAIDEQFDEAVRACAEGEALCPTDVHVLRGRHAWIEARRRKLSEAVQLMRAVLADNASYIWGWHQMAVWLLEQGALVDAGAALEQLRRLRPHDAWVNRQLGFLRLKQEDCAGAQKAFATALESAPTDSVAAHNLLDLQLEASDLKSATATLQVMQTHQPGTTTLAAEIRLRLQEKKDAEALKIFETLCLSPDPDPWPVDTATDALRQRGRGAKALKTIKRAIKTGSGNPEIGAAGVRLLLARSATTGAARFFLKLKPGELRRRAAATVINGLAERKSQILIRWLLWRRREVFFQDDAAWGQVGYALSNFNRMKQVASWLSDWRERGNVQPWMLFNYCLALRYLGRYQESTDVARHCLQTWGHREGAADMHLFLAVEDALAGAVTSSVDHLQRVVVRDKIAYDQEILALARAAVEIQQVPSTERRQQSRMVIKRLAGRFGAWRFLHSMRDVRRTFRRTGDLFHREKAGFTTWLWFKWKLHWQWLLLPLAPIMVVLALQPPILLGFLIWKFARRRNS